MKKISLSFFVLGVLLSGLLLTACGTAPPQSSTAPIAAVTNTPLPPTAPTPTHTTPSAEQTEASSPASDRVETQTPPIQAEPSSTPAQAPTLNPEPSPTPEPPSDWLRVEGRTSDGLVYLGNPDAPVTIFDYSDFM